MPTLACAWPARVPHRSSDVAWHTAVYLPTVTDVAERKVAFMDAFQIAMTPQVGAQDIDSSADFPRTVDACAFLQSFEVHSLMTVLISELL